MFSDFSRVFFSSSVELDFARLWMTLPKIVFSTSRESVDFNSTRKREVIREEILDLKALSGGDMDIGGADLAATFLRMGLVDEVRLYVHPVVLGEIGRASCRERG